MGYEQIVKTISDAIWSDYLVYLCLFTGVYFSIRMLFPQVRLIKDMVKYLFTSNESAKGVSSFQSFAMALGGRVGTGNIAGVATAIAAGGPGAVFWMWAIAFLGASSAYIEAALGQTFKEELDGQYRGGPAYYIERGMGQKWYAIIFAVAAVFGTGVFYPGVQSNAISSGLYTAFGLNKYISGAIICILLALIIFGGVKRIANFAGIVVPIMAVIYVIVAVVILVLNASEIPRVFSLIISSAFNQNAIYGAIFGQTVKMGVKRGIYSNEAGQGTGPIAASAAEVSHPAKQGLVQAFSVYVDTIFVCSATAFMILITDSFNVIGANGGIIHKALGGAGILSPEGTLSAGGPEFTQNALDAFVPGFGSPFIAIALFFFAFTTILAYYYYAESNVAYLFGHLPNHKLYFNILKVAFIGVTFYGAFSKSDLAWTLGDIGVGMMAWLNIIAILILGNIGIKTLKDYEKQKKEGKDPVFRPAEIGIKNAEIWDNKVYNNKN